jgi:hypothetical protein
VTDLRRLGPAQNGPMKTVNFGPSARAALARKAALAGLLRGGIAAMLVGLPGLASAQATAAAAPLAAAPGGDAGGA